MRARRRCDRGLRARARPPRTVRPAAALPVALLALGLLGGSGALGCGEEPAPPPTAQPVVVQPVEGYDLEERIEATGELIARNRAVVAAEVSGRVTEVVRDEGSDVEARAVVIAIDPERRHLEVADVRAQLVQAEASLREARREAERIRALHAKGVASQARLEQVETELRLTRARLDAARARLGVAERALADARVMAPFAGVVAERHVSAGEYVQPGTPLFELVALDPIEAEFSLPEKEAARVRTGQRVDVRVAPYPDTPFPAKVSFVSPTVDHETHTLRVRAALSNPDRRLRPGFFARVDLGVDQRTRVPMVAEEAVLQRADGAVVFRLTPEMRVERRVIETGMHREGRVEVRSGLELGDRVVTRGHYALVSGAQVSLRGADGTPAGDLAVREPGAERATP